MAVDTRVVIGPNASLSAGQALAFFAVTGGVCLGIAGTLAAHGYWPVLPFAGLELAALAVALAVVLRRNRYREVVEFAGARLRLEFGWIGQGARIRLEWPRASTRAWLERGPYPTSPTRLVLAHGGQQLTLGACLTDAERAALARRLQELLHPGHARADRAPGATPFRSV